jgi:hypothetical protein
MTRIFYIVFGMWLAFGGYAQMTSVHAQTLSADDLDAQVRLPSGIADAIKFRNDLLPEHAVFHGAFAGTLGLGIRVVIVVERVEPDGTIEAVYAVADYEPVGISGGWVGCWGS